MIIINRAGQHEMVSHVHVLPNTTQPEACRYTDDPISAFVAATFTAAARVRGHDPSGFWPELVEMSHLVLRCAARIVHDILTGSPDLKRCHCIT